MTDRNEKYKTDWVRCATCRTRRATKQSMWRHYSEYPTHKPCNCDGYRKPHAPTSLCCVHHPNHMANRIAREPGDHMLLARGVRSDEAPF